MLLVIWMDRIVSAVPREQVGFWDAVHHVSNHVRHLPFG